jgi:hypothetical protein
MSAQLPLIGLITASPFVARQVSNIIFDQQLVDSDPAGQGSRTFVIHTSAVTPAIAKAKARVFTAFMRPKRKIDDIQIGVVEEGILVKLYQLEITTILLSDGDETP